MSSTLDLERMTVSDKLRLMEDLWQNLSANEGDLPSPDWHGTVLAERDRLLNAGEDRFMPWDAAKAMLRRELP